MKDTSEFSDASEQAVTTGTNTTNTTNTGTRPKTTTRPGPGRTDGTTPGNQEHDTRNQTRRRPQPQHSNNGPRPERPSSAPRTTTQGNSPARPANQPANQPQRQERNERNERYGGAPRHDGQFTRANNSVATPTAPGSRPAPAHRSGGNGSPYPPRQGTTPNTNTPSHQQQGQQGQQGGRPTTGPGQRPFRPGAPAGSNGANRPGGNGRGPSSRPAGRSSSTTRSHDRRTAALKEKPTGPVTIPGQIVVKDLADLLRSTPNEVIKTLIKHGIFASINEVVDYEKAAVIAQEMGFEPTQAAAPTAVASSRPSANEEMIAQRDNDGTIVIPPVVTIMGHVDHGKTSLLDTIRKTKVAAGEAGGITQHIGAYQVEVHGKKITFLDTPGHEAFTAMRARGAQVTHIAVIVVAADDGVMPQTREAISHAQAAKVPIIIAINKIDKENANPDYVKQQLAEMGIVIEEYGGDVISVPVSARKNIGIDDLLEMILLVAEVQDIRANPNLAATGAIIEARLEKSTGPMATVLVQQGTLKMGDNIVVGSLAGKVRAMFNDRGKRIQKAPPSTPVSIMGLPEVPQAGDRLEVEADERTAKQRAQQEADKRRSEIMPLGQVSLDNLYMQMQEGKVKELNVVLKCDVQGSAEAIKTSLSRLGEENENIKVRLIHEGVGNISETDVHLAAASGAIIVGFNVKADGASQREAQREGVDIRYYNVIYKLSDDIQAALTGMLEPTYREVIDGHAEILQTFKAGKSIVIAGSRVTDGKITRASQIRIMRKNEKVFDGKVASLRRGKDDVREVASGYECGIVVEDFNEFEVGDIVEAYSQERVKTGA